MEDGDEELPPIDGRALSAYYRDGRRHFDRVSRSWRVVTMNGRELVELLHGVESNPVRSMLLMGGLPQVDDTTEWEAQYNELHATFWPALDQRLHNLLAAIVSLVDHTRPLIRFYEDAAPEFCAECEDRNGAVRDSFRGEFVRRFRNYLLHYGFAPLSQRLLLTGSDWSDQFTINLDRESLLAWDDWTVPAREFLESFEEDIHLRAVVVEYLNEMQAVYQWLLEQHQVLHPPGGIPPHLRKGRANWVRYA